MSYYTAKVQLVIPADGKEKKINEVYLVDAMSVTEAEAKVIRDFSGTSIDFEVKSVTSSKIIKIIK